MSQIYDIAIRKYSVLKKDGTWFHYPHRSDISIYFMTFQDDNLISICVKHKGTELGKYIFGRTDHEVISVISKFPSVAFKYSDTITQNSSRFQVTFDKRETYTRCIHTIRDLINIPVKIQDEEVNKGSIITNNTFSASQYELILPMPTLQVPDSQYSWTNNNDSVQASQIPQFMSQNSTNYQGMFDTNMQFPQYLSSVIPYSMPDIQKDIPLENNAGQSQVEKQQLDYEGILDMSDSKLKKLIEDELKKPDFIKLVKKLDWLIENS